MIDTIALKYIPYVDSAPDEGQQRVRWIRNGESLNGSSTRFGNEGELNAAGVCLYKDIEVLTENGEVTEKKVNELVAAVNKIDETLGIVENVEAIQQISKNAADIIELKQKDSDLGIRIDGNTTEINSSKTNISTISNDLSSTKRIIGNYTDEDTSGNPSSGASATGIKRRIEDNTSAIVSQDTRLKKVETTLSETDIVQLKKDFTSLSGNVGTKPSGDTKTIYQNISELKQTEESHSSDISLIKSQIDFDNTVSIKSRVSSNETSISEIKEQLNNDTTGIAARLLEIENELGPDAGEGTINSRVTKNSSNIAVLEGIVGKDTTSGLQKEVAWIEKTLGSNSGGGDPTSGSLMYNVETLSNSVNSISGTIQDLQSEIGNNNEGLKGSVNKLNAKMDGTGGGSTIEALGVFAYSKALGTKVDTKVDEASNDGKKYFRQSKAWKALASSIATLTKDSYTLGLQTDEAVIPLTTFTSSSINSGVTVAEGLTVADAGNYQLKLKLESITTAYNIQVSLKVGSNNILSLKNFSKSANGEYIFGSDSEIVKISAGDVIQLYIKALDEDSSIGVVLNNIKLSLSPIN